MADNEASPDAPIDLKKRARRRLVGASALALLAVIVLPMVMEHDARPTGQDIQIRIPSTETQEAAPKAPKPSPNPAAASSVPQMASGTMETKEQPQTSEGQKPQQPVFTEPGQQIPAEAKAPVASPTKPSLSAASAAVAPDGKSASKSASATASGQWIVRLGLYQNPANVKRLLAKLKEMSVPSYAESADSANGPRTRVGAGPFATREAADRALARIRRIGVDGSVAEKQ